MAFAEGADVASDTSVEMISSGPLLETAQSLLASAQNSRRQTHSMLESAKQDGDALLITCLSDKSDQIDELVAKAETRFGTLKDTKDPALMNLHFAVLSVVAQKVTTLVREAGECVGSEVSITDSNSEILIERPTTPAENSQPVPTDSVVPITPPSPSATTDVNPGTNLPDEPTPASPTF